MKNKKLFTISDIAELTNTPASTVRYYKDNYKEFYPSRNVKGKRYPVYEKQAIEVTELIRDMYSDNKEKHDIYKRLEGKYQPLIDLSDDDTGDNEKQPETATGGQPTNNATTAIETIDSQTKILYRLGVQQKEWIQNQDSLLEHYKKQTKRQNEVIQELEQDNETLRADLEETQQEIERLKSRLKPSLLSKIIG
jgi:DNA-binding transcriptional MerR regulator